MSSSSWSYARPQFNETFERWLATGADAGSQRVVHEALMDLISDPLRWAEEETEHPRIRFRMLHTASGRRIGVLYVIDEPATRIVNLIDIWTES